MCRYRWFATVFPLTGHGSDACSLGPNPQAMCVGPPSLVGVAWPELAVSSPPLSSPGPALLHAVEFGGSLLFPFFYRCPLGLGTPFAEFEAQLHRFSNPSPFFFLSLSLSLARHRPIIILTLKKVSRMLPRSLVIGCQSTHSTSPSLTT